MILALIKEDKCVHILGRLSYHLWKELQTGSFLPFFQNFNLIVLVYKHKNYLVNVASSSVEFDFEFELPHVLYAF